MKKIVAVLLVLSIVGFAFAGGKKEAEEISILNFKVEIQEAFVDYATAYGTENGIMVKVDAVGGGEDYNGALTARAQAGNLPDIFYIEGVGGYETWKDSIYDLSKESWVKDTSVAFAQDGKTYGFPMGMEGFGLIYNAEILKAAGVDPKSLTTREAYETAFKKIDSQKADLGLNAVVSMGASIAGNMWWVATNHNLGTLWSGGMDYNDRSVFDTVLAEGTIDDARLNDYIDYLQLLLMYADPIFAASGTYDQQLADFAAGKTAFLHQGNWVQGNMDQLGADFEMAFAPHAFTSEPQEGIYIFTPGYFVVNKDSENLDAALAFLEAMAASEGGHDFMVNKAKMIPAFGSCTIEPTGDLNKSLVEYNKKGGNYNWYTNAIPDATYTQNVFAPIFDLFAQDPVNNKDQFKKDMKVAIAGMADL